MALIGAQPFPKHLSLTQRRRGHLAGMSARARKSAEGVLTRNATRALAADDGLLSLSGKINAEILLTGQAQREYHKCKSK